MADFKDKYLKYKLKYLRLKENNNNLQKGGGNEHIMNLQKKWFDYIKNDDKTIESRLYDDKRKELNVDDTIKFVNGDESFIKKITNLETYDSFEAAINENNFKLLIPDATTINEALKVYTDIYNDIIEKKQHTDGIILIYFE